MNAAALELLLQLIGQLGTVKAAIEQARAEDRELTVEEVQVFADEADASAARLRDAIAAAPADDPED